MNASQLTRLAAFATAFAAAAAAAPAALAQADSASLSRADVKQQTRAANVAGHMLPAGELIAVDVPATSTITREQRKAETLAANRNGALGDYGQNTWKAENVTPRAPLATSTKTRADRKAATMLAIQHKQMLPAGEAI
jgi:hypothetical protein